MKPAAIPGLISGIEPGSPAEAAGIEAGDQLIEIDGQVPRDAVDVQFYGAGELVTVQLRKANGLMDVIEFEKDYDADLGLQFESATWDGIQLCNNNCFFCFLKGLPRGMRKSLYIKDDDYRLSFLHGNFVTLTNLTEDDWARLEEQRLSPLNVSVHASELGLRRTMLSNRTAPDVLEQLRRLGELGIQAHTQIVLCPGVNDGEHLDRSLADLAALHPIVQTISVVPVGASPKLEEWSLRKDGIEVATASPEYAAAVVQSVTAVQKASRKAFGRSVAQCSDEFYIRANIRVPGRIAYDGLPQYENGIGMVRVLLDDWHRTRSQLRRHPVNLEGRSIVVASGTLAAPVLAAVAEELASLTGIGVEVVGVANSVFGDRVNVSGLVCGEDWAKAVAGTDADTVFLPRHSLDYFGEQFLDGLKPSELSARVGKPVAFASQWSEVVDMLLHGSSPPARTRATNGAMWSEPLPANVVA